MTGLAVAIESEPETGAVVAARMSSWCMADSSTVTVGLGSVSDLFLAVAEVDRALPVVEPDKHPFDIVEHTVVAVVGDYVVVVVGMCYHKMMNCCDACCIYKFMKYGDVSSRWRYRVVIERG